MTDKWKIGVGAICAALAVHISGALRDAEETISPHLVALSFNVFQEDSTSFVVAKSAIVDAINGDEPEKIAADAACAFLSSDLDTTPGHQELVFSIDANVPAQYQSNFLVQDAVSSLAEKIQGATQGGSAGHLYREACFGIS